MNRIIPKLGLDDLKDAQLVAYARDKVEKINAAPEFAAVNPSAAAVQAKTNEYEDALVRTNDGTRADTQYKRQLRIELEQLLTAQAHDCARIANGNLPLYLQTGYEAKNIKGHKHGELPAVTGIKLFYGDNDGELKASWNPMEEADNFLVHVFTDVKNPNGSVIKECIIKKIGRKKTTLSGLPSGQKVFVRVRGNGGSTGQGPWSDIAEKRVP